MFDIPILKEIIAFARWLLEHLMKLAGKRSRAVFEIPKKTIIIVPVSRSRACWWHMGSSGGSPAMQVSVDLFVTNITRYNLTLPVAKLKKSGTLGHVMTQDSGSVYWGRHPLPPGGSGDIKLDFWVIPPFRKEGEEFTSDVTVTDQFGNHHTIKRVRFSYS